MRKDWHKLFEDFFDDNQQEIEVSEPEVIAKNDNMKDYDHLFMMSFDFTDYKNTGKQSLVLKKMMRYIEYILDKTDFVDSYSRVVLYSNDHRQAEKYPDIMVYKDIEETSGDSYYNFAFGFNCIKVPNGTMKAIGFIKKIIQVGMIEHFFASQLRTYKKDRDDYDDKKAGHTFFDITDGIFRANEEGDFRTQQDFLYVLKMANEITGEPLFSYKTLCAKYQKFSQKYNKQLLNGIMDEVRMSTANYVPGASDVVPRTNAVLKKMQQSFDLQSLAELSKSANICLYYKNTFIDNRKNGFVEYQNTSGYSSLVLYKSPENIHRDSLEKYVSENNAKPETMLLKQYDNYTRMALIMYMGTLQFKGNLYDIAIIVHSPTDVNNGVINSEKRWKQIMLDLFDITEKDFYSLWNKKKEPVW